jgi:hypothetical protein
MGVEAWPLGKFEETPLRSSYFCHYIGSNDPLQGVNYLTQMGPSGSLRLVFYGSSSRAHYSKPHMLHRQSELSSVEEFESNAPIECNMSATRV